MSTARDKRYQTVEAFAMGVERYQSGFATNAEGAGTLRRIKLWVGRNKVLSGSALLLLSVVTGFTAQLVQKGREASKALQSLRNTVPTFAIRAKDALQDGQFEEALDASTFAVSLEPRNSGYHALRGNVLQVLVGWQEAAKTYRNALKIREHESARTDLQITEHLILSLKSERETRAKGDLFEAMNAQGRQNEAMIFGEKLGSFWKDRKKDLSALPELVKRLEGKLLPVPVTKALMSNTEFRVGEWKLYLRANGLAGWTQPSSEWIENDEHPVVNVTWNQMKGFCDWLSHETGKQWRLPTNGEWDAAVGTLAYPWGDYYPPHWDDGNYAVLETGRIDPKKVGIDGVLGNAPVGSFKANTLGFYDLVGNVTEWVLDEADGKTGNRSFRRASWASAKDSATVQGEHGKDHAVDSRRTSDRSNRRPSIPKIYVGCRLLRM